MPPVIVDQTAAETRRPAYGTQKAMLELLLADYTRKGFLHGPPRCGWRRSRSAPAAPNTARVPASCPASSGNRWRESARSSPSRRRRRPAPPPLPPRAVAALIRAGHRHRRGVG